MRKKQKKDSKNKLYDFDYESKSEKKFKAKKKKADEKSVSKKKKETKNALKEQKRGQETKKKKYDDEIIIGVTRLPEKENIKKDKKSINRKTKEKETKRRKNSKSIEQYNVSKSNKTQIENIPIGNAEFSKRKNKIIKMILLLILIILAITFALLSPIFKIQNIEVIGNKHISKEELKSLSGIQNGENIFKVNTISAMNNIKKNAYVSEVQIHKRLPNAIQINVNEREPSYMLEYGNGYVYINNQGYMLEISSIKKEIPILSGISTSKEDYKDENRLNEEDLIKLEMVIKIMAAAKNNGIAQLISKIDIGDTSNYTLYLEKEKKVAYLGDCSNLETRMLFLVGILNKEKENSGEIFINMNLNTDNAYFRESV